MAESAALLQDAIAVNGQLVSLPRIQLLKILEFYGPDGIEFRELKASMGMSDGKLLSNLYALRDMGVVEEEKTRVESKTVTTYRITELGREEWSRARTWLLQWLES